MHAGGQGFESPRLHQRSTGDRNRSSPGARQLAKAVDAFLASRRVAGCSPSTLDIYGANLGRFLRSVRRADAAGVHRYLASLRDGGLSASSVHQHVRNLQTFYRWAVSTGMLPRDPLAGFRMKLPRSLPRVPEDADVSALLSACRDDFAGSRNRALVALLADSALRISEALRLTVEDVSFDARTIRVSGGKGGADGVGHFGSSTADALQRWLSRRKPAHPGDLVFVTRDERPPTRFYGARILARLSARAHLTRTIRPHALRRYAATSLLRQTGDLELTRQVLRHSMTLRYARLTQTDVSAKFRRASPLDHLQWAP